MNTPTTRKLTPKQQLFVDSYCGDIKEAAAKAGINYCYARQLLTETNKRHVQLAIKNRMDTVKNTNIMNRQQRQEFWTKMANDEEVSNSDRLRASELLARSEADFLERHEHSLKEYLYDENEHISDEELINGLREFDFGRKN